MTERALHSEFRPYVDWEAWMSDCREEAQDWHLYVEDMIELGERVFTTVPTPPDAPTAPSASTTNPPTMPV